MEYVAYIIVAIISSFLTSLYYVCVKPSGTLKIDMSDPGMDRFKFEVHNLRDMYTKDRIVLTVDRNADPSQQ